MYDSVDHVVTPMLCDSIIARWFHESMCDRYVVSNLPCVVQCKVGDNETLVLCLCTSHSLGLACVVMMKQPLWFLE